MNRALAVILLLGASATALASETVTPPAGVLVVDESYLQSSLSERWDNSGHGVSLIADIPRQPCGFAR